MACLLLGYRYFIFGLFIVCNAIICSVAVWNLSLIHAFGPSSNSQIDAFMVFTGAFGVLFILPLIFIDLFRKDALSGRVWFECTWVAVFWILELAGASAMTAILPTLPCSFNGDDVIADTCASSKVLLAFTWIITLLLLIYLVALAISAAIHQEHDQGVWQANVRFYPWFASSEKLESSPPSPTHAWQKPLHLAAPQPRSAVRPDLERGVIQIQHPYQTTVSLAPAPPVAVAPPRMQQATRDAAPAPMPPQALYPAPIQAYIVPRQDPVYSQVAPALPSGGSNSPLTSKPSSGSSLPRRARSGSPRRPAPLNLTHISAYRAIDERLRH